MRILGLDIGSKRIGVAVSDELGLTAQGLTTITRGKLQRDIKEIVDIITRHRCIRIVVGLPKRTDGSMGPKAGEVTTFVTLLKEKITTPVVFWDERFTTVMAEKSLLEANLSRGKRRKVIDKLAAVLILQNYLDRGNLREDSNLDDRLSNLSFIIKE